MFSYTLIETYKYSTRYPNLRSVICEKIWSHNVKTSFLKVLISLNSHNNPHCVRSVQIRSFFWSVFFRIRTDYGDLLSKFPSSVRLRENTYQKKLRIWTLITQCLTFFDFQYQISNTLPKPYITRNSKKHLLSFNLNVIDIKK